MGKWLFILRASAPLLLLSLLVGCADDFGFLPEPNGWGAQRTKAYPGVVAVQSSGEACTGTFISPRVVLTASHCTVHTEQLRINVHQPDMALAATDARRRVEPRAVLRHGSGTRGDPEDLALLIFAHEEVPQSWVIDIGRHVAKRDLVRLVGFGRGDDLTSVKRTGTNLVFKVGAFIEIVSAPMRAVRGAENRIGAGSGDSGGPLLKEFDGNLRVVGTVHAGYQWRGKDVTEFVNLNAPSNLTWLREKNLQENLGIRGLE